MIINNLIFDLDKITSDSIIMVIIGYTVVFAALLILYSIFLLFSKILIYRAKAKCKQKGRTKCVENEEFQVSGDINAAISMALYLYFEQIHDEESGILTVKRISRPYSPWSSKIYGVMNNQITKQHY